MKEIWKDIPNTHYQISSCGNIKNKNNGRIKVPFDRNRTGYIRAILFDGKGKNKRYFVHRLVAEAFISNPDNKPQVNHKNGNKFDNNVSNLEWTTRSDNLKHCYRILGKKQIGKNHWRSKPVVQLKNGIIIAQFESINQAVKQTGISNIYVCCQKKQRTAGGFEWKYKILSK